MQPGKLPLDMLRRLLSKVPVSDNRILLAGGIGEDAAVIDFGGRLLVAKTDPITFATDRIGWYAVNVNANDLAASGAKPEWFLATVLLPVGYSEAEAEQLFDQIVDACRKLGVSLVGGHTEVTYGLQRPIVVGCMLGEAGAQGVIRSSGAQVGDAVVLTKGLAIEGTALLAREAEAELLGRGLNRRLIERSKELLYNPGISVLEDSFVACRTSPIHSMHDPTEGGLATALVEVGTASGVGILVEESAVPVFPETAAVCAALGLDPLGLLASGALLITLPATETSALLEALEGAGIAARRIGAVTVPEEGFQMRAATGVKPLPLFPRDEVARFLSR